MSNKKPTEDFKRTFEQRQVCCYEVEKTKLSPADGIMHDIDVCNDTNVDELCSLSERFKRTFN